MKLLIVDFCRRWWPAILLACGFAVIAPQFSIAPAALILLLLDSQRGLLLATRPLPVSTGEQSRAWWFVAVALLPMITAPLSILGLAARAWLLPPDHPLLQEPAAFAAAAVAWFALGWSAFTFLLMPLTMAQAAPSRVRSVLQPLLGVLWGLAIPGGWMLMFSLPMTYAQMQNWHWIAAFLTPVFVLASYAAAPSVLRHRLHPATLSARAPHPPSVKAARSRGLQGLPLLHATLAGRSLFLLVVIAGVSLLVRHFFGESGRAAIKNVMPQVLMVALVMTALMPGWINLRSLRMMPISSHNLALVLFSHPVMFGVLIAPVSVVWAGLADTTAPLWLNLLSQAVAVAGVAAAVLAATFYSSARWRFVIFILVPVAMSATAPLITRGLHAGLLAAGGTMLVVSYILLHRGLRKAPSFYRPARVFGIGLDRPPGLS